MTGHDTNQSSVIIEENFENNPIILKKVSSSSFSVNDDNENEMKDMNYHPTENEIKGPYKLLPSNSLEKEKLQGGNLERLIMKSQLEKEESMNISSMINSADTWHLNLNLIMFEESSEVSSSDSSILLRLSSQQIEFEVDLQDIVNNNNNLNFVLSDEECILEEDIKEILLSLH